MGIHHNPSQAKAPAGNSPPDGFPVFCPQHEASKNRQSDSLSHSVYTLRHSSPECFTNSSYRAARARLCSLGFDAFDSQSTVRPSNLPAQASTAPGHIEDSLFQGTPRS